MKIKNLKGKIATRKENNFVKKQNEIWGESFKLLGKDMHKAESNLNEATTNFLKVTEMLDDEAHNDFTRIMEDIDQSMTSYDENIVEPLRCLKIDLNYMIDSMESSKSENSGEVKSLIKDMKYKSFNILQQLECDCCNLQEDIDSWNSNQLVNKDMFTPTSSILHEMFSSEILQMFEEYEVVDVFHKEVIDLYKRYDERFCKYTQEINFIKEKLKTLLWSSKELSILTIIVDIYNRHTPELLKHKTGSIQLDMLDRLLPKKSKLEIIKAEHYNSTLRYMEKRLNSLADELNLEVYNIRNHAINQLFELAEHTRVDDANKMTRNEQQHICDQLHQKLQQMRVKKAEIQRLEDLIAAEERAKLEEQRRKENEKENHRRRIMNSKLAEFHERQSKEKERERLAREEKLKQLKKELKEQLKVDHERVKYREELHQQRLMMLAEEQKRKKQEENEKEKRLEALCQTVAPTVEADFARMVQNTVAYNAKLGIGVKEEYNMLKPLFTTYGFSDQKVKMDPRLRVERELRKLNLQGSDYAREVLAKIKPPTKPRPDTLSTGFKNTFQQNKNNE